MGERSSDQQPDLAGETALLEESQASAFESLLRRVAQTPAAEDLARTDDLGPGVIVAGRFEVVREIGRGGFARVFEARDRVLARPVAIKLLKRRRRLTDPELELFYREARATARLNHPHIVTAYDWGVWNDAPFLVLELLDGESLHAQLTSAPLSESRAWEIAGEIAQALVYAHSRGVLHLDLKSENIVVLRDGRVVERGPAATVTAAPAHPYTRALLAAAPVPDPEAQRQRRELRAAKRPPAPAPSHRGADIAPLIKEKD